MCQESERRALLQLKQGLMDESNVLASWGSKKDCCEWRGIACNNQTGHVITLNLSYNSSDDYIDAEASLRGEIDPSLLELRYLNYLDLSFNDFGGIMIPKFIGSLTRLKELKLVEANFSGPVPPQLGNLSNLHTLDLEGNDVSFESLEWLSHLSSLRYLNISDIDLSGNRNWPQSFSKLTSVIELQLSYCDLGINLRSLSSINSSASFQVLDLSSNSLNSSIFYWISNVSSSNLVHIGLSYNDLQGPIPDVFTNMASLKFLDLSRNQQKGGIPKFFQSLCSLESLYLERNQFSQNIKDSVKILSCAGSTLKNLDLSRNRFWGSLWLDLKSFTKVKFFSLSQNLLNGSLPESMGQISSLEALDLSWNSLNGVITEAHFLNLPRLQSLDVSHNPTLSINLSSYWNPPFQLEYLNMSFCKVGPAFPRWIQTQRNLTKLRINNAGILDSLPEKFLDQFSGLEDLDLSLNKIHGKLPNFSTSLLMYVNLSSNQFSGALPSFPPTIKYLILSENLLSGPLSSLCAREAPNFRCLDLSVNLISRELPNCWMQFPKLIVLNLGKNKFSGKLPSSLGNLQKLRILRLHGNNFSGELPSFENCTELVAVDLGANKLSGKIPTWIGQNQTWLSVLRLRSNEFNGIIPSSLCSLSSIHLLDLSQNNLSGALPHCISNITASSDESRNYGYDDNGFIQIAWEGEEWKEVEMVWKGVEIEFGKNLVHLRSIDISSNHLVGDIPENITSMLKLNSLNLSRNNLTGKVPEKFGNLTMLESLDLSRNQISGRIPSSFSSLNFLSVLDLSYNHLSGRIPLSTQLQSFNASAYIGNSGLCGPPLTQQCPGDGTTQNPGVTTGTENDNDGLISLGFFISAVLGFVTGFWIICGSLLLKRSWRHAYFRLLDDTRDWVYVKTAVYKAKMQRRLQR
ncbi:putative leucine-rich repeat-containing, plant-type, leucine-rich repeat domain, L [Rosa chinensis]|uniref:Putative leucine-rich repeat-containing, plant-type, leucine-rich repeat domain, L n=1 Tax=Rosa chinensis TaxID=74649 RepID=A0A2P6PBK8_ROSCH|nr:receptor-like protein EIX2 [Rosa chinensis]XP_024174175.1 receptor-like protein EIX2 [Rosa chinensis]PRQ19324.1 putative leucine-rich repeat-containing, plant-type, leucine-rich repeat domain, L [Rosa chinensis]